MEPTINKALEALKAHFVNGPHHLQVFMNGENYRSLYTIACESLRAMFSTPENQARLSVYIAGNGEDKAVQTIMNQGKALILQGLLAIAKA